MRLVLLFALPRANLVSFATMKFAERSSLISVGFGAISQGLLLHLLRATAKRPLISRLERSGSEKYLGVGRVHLSAWTVQEPPCISFFQGVWSWGVLGLYSCKKMEKQKSLEHQEGRWLALLPLALL